MPATYHNHSSWSDGKAELIDLVRAAERMGIDELGVSDHWVLHPKGHLQSWAMDPNSVAAYAEEVRALQAQTNVTIRLGLEVDWFTGHGDAIRKALEGIEFDYLIGSVHEIDDFVVDASPARWQGVSQQRINELYRLYWHSQRTLAESGLFTIAAHLDLPKKFRVYPTDDMSNLIGEALHAIAEAGMVVELNTAGWHKPCEDAYPTLDILQQCNARGIRTTLSADAHQPEHLLRDFDRGVGRLRAAGYDEIARFEQGEIRMDPLA